MLKFDGDGDGDGTCKRTLIIATVIDDDNKRETEDRDTYVEEEIAFRPEIPPIPKRSQQV